MYVVQSADDLAFLSSIEFVWCTGKNCKVVGIDRRCSYRSPNKLVATGYLLVPGKRGEDSKQTCKWCKGANKIRHGHFSEEPTT
jgi:hypothetical protein